MTIDDPNDVNVDPETTATIGTETTETVEPVVDDKLSATETTESVEPVVDEEAAEIDAEIDKQLAEKPEDVEELRYFRQLLRNKEKEARAYKSKTPEFSENDRLAIDLYNGLTAFDSTKGVPTSVDFAKKLVETDAQLAQTASWDLLSQQISEDGWTIGHEFLRRIGLDPYKLDDLRKFSSGEIKGDDYGIVAVPDFVPPEVAEAYKVMSKPMRENIDWMLEDGDPAQKQSALESLQDKQSKMEYENSKKEYDRIAAESTQREIETAIDNDVVTTFDTFMTSFKETPTYTNVSVSGNPEVDMVFKDAVSSMLINLSEPDSVVGKHSMAFFKALGVNVDSSEIQTAKNAIIGSIEESIRAEKGGYQTVKARALSDKTTGMNRLSGLRNRLFVDAMQSLATKMKTVSEANGKVIDGNAAIPSITGNSSAIANGQKAVSTLEMIKNMSAGK